MTNILTPSMKRTLAVLVMILCLSTAPAAANAAGVGLYASLGKGSSDWDGAGTDFSSYDTFNMDTRHKTVGVVLDTRLGGEGVINYHMDLGFDKFTVKHFLIFSNPVNMQRPVQTNLSMDGFVWSHALGFGAEIGPGTRAWIGPELRLEWADGEPVPGVRADIFGVGFGPAVGVSIALSERFSAALKVGYDLIKYDADISGSIGSTNVTRTYDVEEKLLYVNLELFAHTFRER